MIFRQENSFGFHQNLLHVLSIDLALQRFVDTHKWVKYNDQIFRVQSRRDILRVDPRLWRLRFDILLRNGNSTP